MSIEWDCIILGGNETVVFYSNGRSKYIEDRKEWLGDLQEWYVTWISLTVPAEQRKTENCG